MPTSSQIPLYVYYYTRHRHKTGGAERGAPPGLTVPVPTVQAVPVPAGQDIPTGQAIPTGQGRPAGQAAPAVPTIPSGQAVLTVPTGQAIPTVHTVPTGLATPAVQAVSIPTGQAIPTAQAVPTGQATPTAPTATAVPAIPTVPPERRKCLTAKIIVKTKKKTPRPSTVPAAPVSVLPDSVSYARLPKDKRLPLGDRSLNVPKTFSVGLNGTRIPNGNLLNSTGSGRSSFTTADLTNFLKIKAFSLKPNQRRETGTDFEKSTRSGNMEGKVEFDDMFAEFKGTTPTNSVKTITLPQRQEVFRTAEIARGMSGRNTEMTRGPSGRNAEIAWGMSGQSAEMTRGMSGQSAEMTRGMSGRNAEIARGMSDRNAEIARGMSGRNAETTKGPSGRKYAHLSGPRRPSYDVSTLRPGLHQNGAPQDTFLHSENSFVVKRVNWHQRQVAPENNIVERDLQYPEKCQVRSCSSGQVGDQDEDAISWVLRENNPALTLNSDLGVSLNSDLGVALNSDLGLTMNSDLDMALNSMKAADATDGKDDSGNVSGDEADYSFEKPIIHITHKIKKREKKAVDFDLPVATENLSLKSVSDSDSDTQLQPPKFQLQQVDRSPRSPSMKLRTRLVSDVENFRPKTPIAGNNDNLLIKGITPRKLEYKFEETFPIKSYLGSAGIVQQVAAANRVQVTTKMAHPGVVHQVAAANRAHVKDKMAHPSPILRPKVSNRQSGNRGRSSSVVVPTADEDKLTVKSSPSVPTVNYLSYLFMQDTTATGDDEPEPPGAAEIRNQEEVLSDALSSKLYKVVKHQRHKQTITCSTPPCTPESTSPRHKAKLPDTGSGDERPGVAEVQFGLNGSRRTESSASHGKGQHGDRESGRPSTAGSRSSGVPGSRPSAGAGSQPSGAAESRPPGAAESRPAGATESRPSAGRKKKLKVSFGSTARPPRDTDPDTHRLSSKEEIVETEERSDQEEQEDKKVRKSKKSKKMVDKGSDRLKDIYMDKLKKSIEPVRIFSKKPTEDPLKVCFDFTGTDLTHKQVKMAASETLSESEGCHVTSVEFVPRNVILGTTWCDNRWVVKVNNELAQRMISGKGIHLRGDYVRMRPYQDVIEEEYQRFVQKKQPDGGPSFIDDLLAA